MQDVAFQSISEKIDLKSLPVSQAGGLTDQAQQPFSGPIPGESSSRIFAFPSYSLGTLRPIKGEQLIAFSHGQFVSGQHVEAKGIVLIKNFQGLNLEPSNVLSSNPVLFKSFRDDDIAILSFYDSFSDFDAPDLAAIAGFKSLEQLDLDHANQLGDRALDQIASLPNLKLLTLTPAKFSPGKLATFPTMKRLNRIALKGFNDTNGVLKSIDGSDSLNDLFFDRCTVDAQGLKYVASIRQLHSLHFDACKIHNDDFAGLSQSNSIEGFLVRDCPDVDIHLFDQLKLGSFKDIRLGGSQWTPAVLSKLRKTMPKVNVISLQHAQHGEDEFQGTLNDYLK